MWKNLVKWGDVFTPFFIIILLLIVIYLLRGSKEVSPSEKLMITPLETADSIVLEVPKTLSLTDSIELEISQYNFKFPQFIMAQAILESGLNSRLFLTNNNLFGMKIPGRRITVAKGNPGEYAKYSSWQESILDRYLYEAIYLRHCQTEGEYLKCLTSWAEDPEYLNKLVKISKKLK